MPTTPPSTPIRPKPGSSHGTPASKKRKHAEVDLEQVAEPTPRGAMTARKVNLAGSCGYFDDLIEGINDDNQRKDPSPDLNPLGRKWSDLRALAYFVKHDIDHDDMGNLVQSVSPLDPKRELLCKKHDSAVARYQHAILEAIRNEIKAIIRSRDPIGAKSLGDMDKQERKKVWAAHFRKNPLGVCLRMWKPFVKIIAFDMMFHIPNGVSDKIRGTLQRWATYCFKNWLYGAEASFLFRWLAPAKGPEVLLHCGKETEYSLWKKMPLETWMKGTPTIEEIPVQATSTLGNEVEAKSDCPAFNDVEEIASHPTDT
ncbi:uncharacterized protein J3D65DRAFT_322446 [Phyllosticta citribraziliensis]|uniref:Uncharacterized protein n=1 Tax=Phyllosticta citribraziliensis TaxID=989973 RepID=A0ABR1LSZ3_9PEZI